MTWIEYLGNKKPIESLFSQAPCLSCIRILEITLHQDGPRMSVRINLNEFPEKPPKIWVDNGFNRVQLTLSLIGVTYVSIQGWTTDNIVSFSFRRHHEKIFLKMKGEGVDVKSEFFCLEIEKIAAYCSEEDVGQG